MLAIRRAVQFLFHTINAYITLNTPLITVVLYLLCKELSNNRISLKTDECNPLNPQ
jgi:hypothetical protein